MSIFNQDQKYINAQFDKLDSRYGAKYKILISDNQGNKTHHINITDFQSIQIQKILLDALETKEVQ